jgi:hypothetical protein
MFGLERAAVQVVGVDVDVSLRMRRRSHLSFPMHAAWVKYFIITGVILHIHRFLTSSNHCGLNPWSLL